MNPCVNAVSRNCFTIISIIIITAITAMTLMILLSAGNASAHTIHVDDDAGIYGDGSAAHPYGTVEEAMNASEPGDTVFLINGTYQGLIVVRDNLTFLGQHRTGVVMKDLLIEGNDTTFRNVSAVGEPYYYLDWPMYWNFGGQVSVRASNCSFEDVNFQLMRRGILFGNGSGNASEEFSGLRIKNCLFNGSYIGLEIYGSCRDIHILDCRFTDNLIHISANGEDIIVEGCDFGAGSLGLTGQETTAVKMRMKRVSPAPFRVAE